MTTLQQAEQALEVMLASAYPHPTEHPTMTAAWELGRSALADLRAAQQQPDAGAVIELQEAVGSFLADMINCHPDHCDHSKENPGVCLREMRERDYLDLQSALSASALRAYRESQPGPWQGIESAPKDDNQVDLWTDNGRFTDCWWCDERQDWMHWWINDFDRMGPVRLGEHVTHWMPKVPPPAQEGGAA